MNNLIDAKHRLLLEETAGGESAQLVMSLLTTTRRIDAACASLLARDGLSEGMFSALLAVNANPGIAPGGLADQLSVTRATVTGLVDGLVKRGMLERAADPVDRRSQTLRVTASGERLVGTLAGSYSTWLDRLTVGIPAGQFDAVFAALATIQRNVRNGEAP